MASDGVPMRTGLPSMVICPESGGSSPYSTFMSVLLPAPFSPTTACTSPAYRSIETPSLASTVPQRREMSRSVMAGAGTTVGGTMRAASVHARARPEKRW